MLALSGMDYVQMHRQCMLSLQLCGMKTKDYQLSKAMLAEPCGKCRYRRYSRYVCDNGEWKSYMTFIGCCVFTF